MQTIVITRVIFSILAVPVAIIAGAMLALGITFYAFTVNPLLALVPLVLGIMGVLALARWEKARIEKETPPRDEGY